MTRARKLLVCVAVVLLTAQAQAGDVARLAADGKALHAVVISEDASDRLEQAAETLADYLGRIGQAPFEVKTGDGVRGISVGTARSFPALEVAARFDSEDVTRREEYLLRSHAEGLWLIGATELAAEHAVWDLLYRLGYRQFFPAEVWEVVPTVPELSIRVDVLERPDYLSRRIWYGHGFWDYNAHAYQQWCARNRCLPGIQLNTGHAYDGVVKTARSTFDAHPEYWPLLNGQRQPVSNPKPCLGNSEVRALFVQHALSQFAKNPELDSISMDPSDGGGWCECEQCARLGSVSDQVTTLANEVASAVNEKYPGKRVGIYAYNYHSPPPGVRVNPNVVVSVATAFIKGGLTLDEIVDGWSKQGATLGIREYYSVNTWDRDLPARARGGNLDYLCRTIPQFHARGARFMSAEASDNWGPNGLGYYLAARMLWDVNEADHADARIDDFLTRAFGPARDAMREFYRQLDASHPHLVVDDQLGRMFGALRDARSAADTPDVRARIDQLALYTHYCSLFDRYSSAEGDRRQVAFETLIRHAYRMRTTMLVHSKALYRDLVNRDKTVTMPAGAGWNVPEQVNPWKSSEPFRDEIAAMIRDGIAAHPLVELEFTPVEFSTDLVPAARAIKSAETVPPGEFGSGRGLQTFYTSVENVPATIELHITGGLITHYRDRGNVKVKLWKLGGESETGELQTLIASDESVPPDGVERTIRFPLEQIGLFRIDIDDGRDRTLVTWPAGQPMTVSSSLVAPMSDSYPHWTAYFYVPTGTQTIGLFGGGRGEVRDSQGRRQFSLDDREPNYYAVSVPAGEDGKIWQARNIRGALRLLTVPPCFSTTPQDLLLPIEVVEKDARP